VQRVAAIFGCQQHVIIGKSQIIKRGVKLIAQDNDRDSSDFGFVTEKKSEVFVELGMKMMIVPKIDTENRSPGTAGGKRRNVSGG